MDSGFAASRRPGMTAGADTMHALRYLFSPSGRLEPKPFVLGAMAIYAAGIASQLLTAPDVITRAGLWPFAVVQALLIWVWFSLHAKRLHDSGHSAGWALAASILYALAVILLLIVATGFIDTSAAGASDRNATSALTLILFVYIVAILSGSPSYDLVWVVIAVLSVMALLPLLITLAVTLWAATRPSAASNASPGAAV
jgi:uncharacterized membrane protein YhaH (DUF805 family)